MHTERTTFSTAMHPMASYNAFMQVLYAISFTLLHKNSDNVVASGSTKRRGKIRQRDQEKIYMKR